MSSTPKNPLAEALAGRRVVLGHDWLTGMRGGERVLELFCQALPDSPLVTLLADTSTVSEPIRSREIVTSFMQRIPGVARSYRKMLPIMGLAATTTRVPDCDVFLTTNSCVAHAFVPPQSARMVCYCFTPMRYAWLFPREYLGPAKAAIAAPYLAYLRRWDRQHTRRVDSFIAISDHVKRRISDFYGRESQVVFPPVDTDRCTPAPGAAAGNFDLVVSALVPYKRIDLAVRAYSKSGFPLKIVGVGSSSSALRVMAAPNVEFLGWRSDDEILELYRHCRFLIFPGEEDYGIVPLEAMACGKPVVAFGRGGATETVVAGATGVFFGAQSEEALAEAVARAEATRWDASACRARAEEFSVPRFLESMAQAVSGALAR